MNICTEKLIELKLGVITNSLQLENSFVTEYKKKDIVNRYGKD